MYMDDYKRWLEADLEDAALKAELEAVAGNEEEIKDRFAVALQFGTAGLRGVLVQLTGLVQPHLHLDRRNLLRDLIRTQRHEVLVEDTLEIRGGVLPYVRLDFRGVPQLNQLSDRGLVL